MHMKTKEIIITGYGRVAKEFVELLDKKEADLIRDYQAEYKVVGIICPIGMVYEKTGLSLSLLRNLPSGSKGLSQYANIRNLPLQKPTLKGDILLECTPTNLETGEPALSYMKEALDKRMDIISLSKGALVHALPELLEIARSKQRQIKYSGATAAALPTLDIGEYSLAGSNIVSMEGILNGTSNFILTRMSEDNLTFEQALHLAQEKGIAEKNPSLDVEGLDSACKILLLANGLLHTKYTLKDISIEGIQKITKADMQMAKINGCEWKLMATAKIHKGEVFLEVKPQVIHPDHPLFHVRGTNKGMMFHTEEMGTICCIGGASHPRAAAAAAFKDMLNLANKYGNWLLR